MSEHWMIRSGEREGCGGFLDAPGYPTHTHSIVSYRGSKPRDFESISSLRYDLEDWIPADIRAQAKALLDAWHANPPSIDSAEVQDWIHQVLGYFRNCWRGKGPEPECWHANKLEIVSGPLMDGVQVYAIEKHAGVHMIRKFYPEFTPSAEDWARAYWGKKPEVA